MPQQSLDLRGKQERAITANAIEEGFLAHAVACGKESVFLLIEECKGKIAAQPAKAFLALFLIEMGLTSASQRDRNGGLSGEESRLTSHEPVVDLAVENQVQAFISL